LQAGLEFCVRGDKDFIGSAALDERDDAQRLVCITLGEPRAVALGNEPVQVDRKIVGRVTSGGYGYTVEKSIAYAYVPKSQTKPGTAVEIDIFGEWVEGEIAAEPLYDPESQRVRG
jgi:4-methylaminobutanoate oxidase (formaldehyde-forming)